MGIFITLFVLAFNGAWLWFCFVYVTKSYAYSWKEMMLWALLAYLVGGVVIALAGELPPGLEHTGGIIVGNLLIYTILYLILTLRFQVEEFSQKFKILLAHFVGVFILSLVLRAI